MHTQFLGAASKEIAGCLHPRCVALKGRLAALFRVLSAPRSGTFPRKYDKDSCEGRDSFILRILVATSVKIARIIMGC